LEIGNKQRKDINEIEKELIILKEEKSEKSGILNKFAELKENKIKSVS